MSRKRLARLAKDAVRRMTPEQRALHDEILRISKRFGKPISVNRLLRQVRKESERE